MRDELRTKFVRARLAAILEHELRESGVQARSYVAIAPRLGYFVAINDEDSFTIRLVQE
jgi:uncharacterized protein YmfQ (DUF2313 family)